MKRLVRAGRDGNTV